MMIFAKRNTLLGGVALAMAGLVSLDTGAAFGARAPAPIAELAPALSPAEPISDAGAYLEVAGGRIWYWDTGGRGRPLFLAHPGTGSALIWGYQRDAFVKAGYRVIAWSRRGFYRSERKDGGGPNMMGGSDVEDLEALVTKLGITRFDAIGSAAGGGAMLRYAAAHPDRIRSLVIACSLGDVQDDEYSRLSASLRPAAFMQMPADFRELSPSYRARNPEGVKAWLAMEALSRGPAGPGATTAAPPPPMPSAGGTRPSRGISWQTMRSFKFPVLWLTGDADLYTPPPLLQHFHDNLPGSDMVVIQGAGHSAYWEQPRAFNAATLNFLAKAR